MKKKKDITTRIKEIFSHAVALQQSGRLRNTIYCYKNFVHILNQDHTVFIRFELRLGEVPFSTPISFAANDFDSNNFTEKDGRICFTKEDDEYKREKWCKTPEFDPLKVAKSFNKRIGTKKKRNRVALNKQFLSHLDEDLSHIEFSIVGGQFVAKQRNIYTGSVLNITKQKTKGFEVQKDDKLKDRKPVGIRTNDLIALFSFVDSVFFYFTGKNSIMFESTSQKMPFEGLISQCIYDELGG